ncbi:unnamed protein product [Amoebophrya sp. A120]|nr:unnamed protein product [Amoebophrya sp. A120]|eukprot:GSA120T00019530001.1
MSALSVSSLSAFCRSSSSSNRMRGARTVATFATANGPRPGVVTRGNSRPFSTGNEGRPDALAALQTRPDAAAAAALNAAPGSMLQLGIPHDVPGVSAYDSSSSSRAAAIVSSRAIPSSILCSSYFSERKPVLSRPPSTSRRFFSTSSSDQTDNLVMTEVLEDKAVAICCFNRPKALNALNDSMVSALIGKLKEFDTDDRVRAIVVTGFHPTLGAGTEKAFAAGADIKQMNEKDYGEVNKCDMLGFWNDIKTVRKPIIASINGFALGGGCELAMACDVLVASESAKFGQPEVKLGTIPGGGGSQRLTHAVGKSNAMWWMLSGEMFSAEEALKCGLVTKVFPKEDLFEKTVEMAAKIAAFSSPVLNMVKECVNQAANLPLDQGLLFERRVFHATWGLQDRKEGMTAFAEKREAKFEHK